MSLGDKIKMFKQISAIVLLLFSSNYVLADSNKPNFDSKNGVLLMPVISIDNEVWYGDVKLQLDFITGQFSVIAATPIDEGNQPIFSGIEMYPALTGNIAAEFIDLNIDEGSYFDITTFKANLSLLDMSLAEIDSDFTSDDFIYPGEYKVKIDYQPTSNIPGNVTIFSLPLLSVNNLSSIQSKSYSADGSLGTYSSYYKLNLDSDSYIDITTNKATVYLFNRSIYGDDVNLNDHYEVISGNRILHPGSYVFRFKYTGTSLTPGVVVVQLP